MKQPNPIQPSPIDGYDYGAASSAISPVSETELAQLEQSSGWTAEDAATLAQHAGLFRDRAESMVDSWRAVIGSQSHLAQWFTKPDGAPDDEYKSAVKRRFVQWIADVVSRPHDRDWLNYQQEIGLRHTPAKKNLTDNAQTPPLVPFRYLLGFLPVILAIRDVFADAIRDEAEVNRIQDAWTKAVLLHITLWSRAYTTDGLW